MKSLLWIDIPFQTVEGAVVVDKLVIWSLAEIVTLGISFLTLLFFALTVKLFGKLMYLAFYLQ